MGIESTEVDLQKDHFYPAGDTDCMEKYADSAGRNHNQFYYSRYDLQFV